MFMFGGMDPKKMQAMMRQMGIKQDEIEATRVIIEKADGNIVIEKSKRGEDNYAGTTRAGKLQAMHVRKRQVSLRQMLRWWRRELASQRKKHLRRWKLLKEILLRLL